MPDAHHDDIAKLESLYQEHPEGRVFTHLAEAYRKGGELERARQVLSEGIERHPDYSSAHVVLGRVLMDQDRTDEAEAAFQRVLDLDPHNLIAIRSLGDLARGRGDDGRALEYYHRLLDQEPGEDEVREIVDEMTTGLTVGDVAAESDVPERAWTGGATVTLPEQEDEGPEPEPEDEFSFSLPGDEPARAADPGGEPSGGDAEVRTETIAQVYARQGLYDRAAEVYRELVRSHPDDEGLRERLAEMEQLAEARTDRSGEVEAVSDLDLDLDEEESDRVSGLERAQEEAPAEAESTGFGLEGFQSMEVDTSEVEAPGLPDLEIEESDPGTGLRADASPETAAPEEDLSEELDVTDVPEPPEEAPWSAELAVETAEPDPWTGERAVEPEESPEPEEPEEPEGAESVWTGADWRDEPEPESTPHAWTEEEEEEDSSPPIRAYLGGLLSWSREGRAAEPAAPIVEPERSFDSPEAAESAGSAELGESAESAESAESVGPSGSPAGQESPEEEDDDLDMFRSWLESLKQ